MRTYNFLGGYVGHNNTFDSQTRDIIVSFAAAAIQETFPLLKLSFPQGE